MQVRISLETFKLFRFTLNTKSCAVMISRKFGNNQKLQLNINNKIPGNGRKQLFLDNGNSHIDVHNSY